MQPPVPPLGKPTTQQLANIREGLQAYQSLPTGNQMAYDGELWYQAITLPGTPEKGEILKRIFTVLRWGGFYFRPKRNEDNWRSWHDVGWPIASALSHGSRVMIQLPRTDPRRGKVISHGFFTWLTNGHADTGVCFNRQGTHSTGNRPGDWSQMPDGRIKVLQELSGASHGGAQAMGLSSGQSFGINLALGGNLRKTFATNQLITDNGDHGHLYIFYRPPTSDMYGGVLLGCEGEAPGRYGASGNFHSWNIGFWDKFRKHKPSSHEGQFGPKWANKQGTATFQLPDPHHPQQQLTNGPDRYDSMIVDLTATGWRFLRDHADNFTADMVKQAAEPAPPIAVVPKDANVVRQLRALSPVVGQEYQNFPQSALQLRLGLLNTHKDVLSGHTPLKDSPSYKGEFNALVHAIYGN